MRKKNDQRILMPKNKTTKVLQNGNEKMKQDQNDNWSCEFCQEDVKKSLRMKP